MSETTPITTDGLYGTSITLRWIETKLQNVFKTKSKFGENIKTERIGFGQGFLSVFVQVIADWTKNDEKLPKSFVVKIPSTLSFRETMKTTNLDDKLEEMNKETRNAEVDMNKMFDEFERTIPIVSL